MIFRGYYRNEFEEKVKKIVALYAFSIIKFCILIENFVIKDNLATYLKNIQETFILLGIM